MSVVKVLYNGYSDESSNGDMKANCSCVLVKSDGVNVIIDTMTAWDAQRIQDALLDNGLEPNDIDYCIGTHGHPDHVGNLNLFLSAVHIVGFSVYKKDVFVSNDLAQGRPYIINDDIQAIPSPGHTLEHVSVIVKTAEGVVAIAGDLFEKEADIVNPEMWKEAGSEDQRQQMYNRHKIATLADVIVPGHGPEFIVTDVMRDTLRKQCEDESISIFLAKKSEDFS